MFRIRYWSFIALLSALVPMRLHADYFAFKKEVMAQFAASDHYAASSRFSIGGELQKKFSTPTSTVASLDVQLRVVRRDRFVPVQNDMEGMNRQGLEFEYHNAYLDLYNVAGPVGLLNVRAGRFYVPFGLNLQTDTHGTILQLSNEENFGFERDWYTGLWGSLNEHVNYDLNYLVGSGYHPRFDGQQGLGSLRLSLANRYSYEHGVEGGLSFLGGERLNVDREEIQTWRTGLDGRYRHTVPTGLLTATGEWSGGEDEQDPVLMQLYQGEYLHHTRRWGMAGQYRRFWQDMMGSKASLIGEVTWYFQNDVGNTLLHWIKLNIEKQVEAMQQPRAVIVTLQYYRYW